MRQTFGEMLLSELEFPTYLEMISDLAQNVMRNENPSDAMD